MQAVKLADRQQQKKTTKKTILLQEILRYEYYKFGQDKPQILKDLKGLVKESTCQACPVRPSSVSDSLKNSTLSLIMS